MLKLTLRRSPLLFRVCLMLLPLVSIPGGPATAQERPTDQERPAPQEREEPPPSAEAQEQARAFLEEVYEKYYLPYRMGLESFEAKIEVRKCRNAELERFLDRLDITYTWNAPRTARVQVRGVSGVLRKVLEEPLQGIWRDLVAGAVFADLEGRTLAVEGMEEGTALTFGDKATGGRILFDPDTKLVLRAEVAGRTGPAALTPSYGISEGRLRLEKRSIRGRMSSSHGYSAFRQVNEWYLPTQLTLDVDNDHMELGLSYTLINNLPAVLEEMDLEKVKALVKEFDSTYTKLSSPEKLSAMKKLEETGHELAAVVIAKRALRDRDLKVRQAAASTLGAMKCRKVVSSLTKAMKPNEENLDVYLEIVGALGDIGDPKAIPALSDDVWSQRDQEGRGNQGAKARIEALGDIRSRKSVDALIDMMYAAKQWHMRTFSRDFTAALKKLTGQDFGWNRDEWKSWWSKNKNRFKLEEDQ